MEVKLIVVSGKHAGKVVPVAGPKFFIGRAEDCQLRPGSDLVSRHHCVILVEEGLVTVRDFGSKNGTFVNAEKVKNEQELKSGDVLKVGPLEFEVRLAVEVGGKKKPKVRSVQEAAARTVQTADDEEELDIFSLLGEEKKPPAAAGMADTRPVSATPTTRTELPETAQMPAEEPQEKPKKEKKKKKETGGLVGRFKDAKKINRKP